MKYQENYADPTTFKHIKIINLEHNDIKIHISTHSVLISSVFVLCLVSVEHSVHLDTGNYSCFFTVVLAQQWSSMT